MYRKSGILFILGVSCIGLIGCMTEATQERFRAEGTNAQACKLKMMDAKVQIAKWKADEARNTHMSPVGFKDDKMALIGMMIKQQGELSQALIVAFTAKAESVDQCDRIIVAMVKADAAKVAGINSASKQAIGWVAGLIGLGIISDNWGPSNYGAGDGGDTWNVSGSRVNSKSGNSSGSGNANASSSGTGLGFGNTFNTGDGQAVGGLEPRTTNANGDVADLTTGSNSGENAAIAPIEQEPTQLPAE